MITDKHLAERFERYAADHHLFTPSDRVLLAVSGGVDSMVMMSLFARYGCHAVVAHCNFQLRGAESDEDEVLVEREAARYGMEFHNRRFDTLGEMERTGDSMEMAARRLRYEWFYELCESCGCTAIAVAHHIDDSIETFFINLLRGTGLRGLTGIRNRMGRVVRPLMFATRKEILEYAVAEGIPYREDSSNVSKKYLRNKIRLGLVPMIREINPKFTDLMRTNIDHLTDARFFIAKAIELMGRDVVESCGDTDILRPDRIDEGYPRDFVIYELLNSRYEFKGDTVAALCRSLAEGQTGKRFYSKDYAACIERDGIAITPIADEDACESQVEADAIRCYCGNSVLYFERTDIDLILDFGVPENVALLDADKLEWPLTLRRWREGDRFVPFGMSGRKKVGDFLTDLKTSVREKQRQFVLVSGGEIVWVVGRRIDDRFRLTSATENVLKITREIL
ncbi:MAG: tRNA lysidine(34) synthetase TilS [Alistipes sp.]|nr:tRNA lysidine(34) synthetase TilS [Alistipes sp.]